MPDGRNPNVPEHPAAEPDKAGAATGGDSLQDASDEAVQFMEEGDEPGHAGRGDGG